MSISHRSLLYSEKIITNLELIGMETVLGSESLNPCFLF